MGCPRSTSISTSGANSPDPAQDSQASGIGPLGPPPGGLLMPRRLPGVREPRGICGVSPRSEGGPRMTSSKAGVASHTFRSKLVDEHPIPEVMAVRREIKRQDRAFVVRLRASILAGTETAHGVLGHVRRPRD